MLFINRVTVLLTLIIICTTNSLAQRELDFPGNQDVFRERIEHIRKTRLMDVLNLQGSDVQRFFSRYDSTQRVVSSKKVGVDKAAEELRAAIEREDPTSVLVRLTEELQNKVAELDKSMQERTTDFKSTLDSVQFAKYVLFEVRFQEELQRMILKRVRRGRK